jgi:uncharacterized repeat protein (TIGR01451 family)
MGGNVEAPPHQATIKIDKHAPRTTWTLSGATPGADGIYAGSPTITLSAADPPLLNGEAGSGVAASYLQAVPRGTPLTSIALTNGWTTVSGPLTLSKTGPQDVYAFSVDRAGNVENPTRLGTLNIASGTDLSASAVGPASATAGTDVAYDFGVKNLGVIAAQNVVLTYPLPAQTTFVSATQAGAPTLTCTTPAAGSNGTLICSIAALATAANATVHVVVHVLPGTPNGVTLAHVASVVTTTPDTNPANDLARVNTTVATLADLALTKTAPATIVAGTDLTYALQLHNAGPSDASTVTLSDVLPPGTTFVSQTSVGLSAGTCATPAVGSGGTLRCTIGSLAVGGNAQLKLSVHVDGGLPETTVITNTATLTAVTQDPNAANNSSSASTVVLRSGGGGGPGDGGGGPPPTDTPELDSLLLFGAGFSGLLAYGVRRVGRWPRRRYQV